MSKTAMLRTGLALGRVSPPPAGQTSADFFEQAERPLEEVPSQADARPVKTFSLHIGADLKLPTQNSRRHSSYEVAPAASPAAATASDPFAGLPFRAMAERLGASMSPVVQAVREDARTKRLRDAGLLGQPAPEPEAPHIPHFLPFTRWAAQSDLVKSTLVVDKDRKKARLSWYHPDDTMVPRNWFKGGLLEDLKYYSPFSRAAA